MTVFTQSESLGTRKKDLALKAIEYLMSIGREGAHVLSLFNPVETLRRFHLC